MKKLFGSIIFIVFIFVTANAQIAGGESISKKDSILLNKFWQHFKKSIDQKNKIGVEESFKFPFYCRPCLDYTAGTDSSGATVKVTRKIFNRSVYKLFFNLPERNNSTKSLWENGPYFSRVDGNENKDVFTFSYAIIAPSKHIEGRPYNVTEGIQGFIYLKKIDGQYLIDGLDTVP